MDVEAYIGEIRMFAGNYAPEGWAFCNGQIMSISSNDILFTLLGTTYGGDGVSTFALPDLQGRVPVHNGTGVGLNPIALGEAGGVTSVSITTANVPPHTHLVNAANEAGTTSTPGSNLISNSAGRAVYVQGSSSPDLSAMSSQSVSPAGVTNINESIMQPYRAISFIIALTGVFPTNNS
ncbi:phage tail protein [Mucilaginibacter robiniae]|uniref:Phage tail protein n=1 Tax=Mucilaginibacter robiniae TaxID=2728022 RepID=A0A7L5DVV9_9SPHI|nr:tail fiber protein [Mucilaginibacter robiniae]QJD95222.1 phage tail protein [Mucilaginibacter robiniae]